MKYGFIIDNRKCIGCHACTVACKSEHEVPLGVNRTWVKYIEKGSFPDSKRFFTVMRCNHCESAPCVTICPVTALYKREDGIVDFDNKRCIGCKACMQACPYDALYIDPDTHTAAKCNYCANRVDIGLNPSCVNVCPTEAIIAGDLDDPDSNISKIAASNEIFARKPEKNTKPQLFYINSERESLVPTAAKQNTGYIWNSQEAGVGHFSQITNIKGKNSDKVFSVPADEYNALREDETIDNNRESAVQVYDAPGKGVLWGWEVPAYLWTKSIAAGLFLLLFILNFIENDLISVEFKQICDIVSLNFIGLTGLLLIKDLDKPSRFLYVVLRPQWDSWLVKGAYSIMFFSMFLLFSIAKNYINFGFFGKVIDFPGAGFAVLTAIYTAFLFNQAKGRDFWQSHSMWFHMFVQSLIAGSAILIILSYFISPNILDSNLFILTCVGFIISNLIITVIDLFIGHGTVDARYTVKLITRGRFKYLFLYGGIILGNLVPIILLFTGSNILILSAAIMQLAGLLIIEYIWVKAPQLIPLS